MKKIIYAIVLLILIGLITAPIYYNLETQQLTVEVRKTTDGSYIELSQGITHYQQANKGADKTVVLVHGFSVPYYIWQPTYAFLAEQGFHVIRYDLLGRGYSDRPDLIYDQALFDKQLMDLLAGLAIDKPVDIIGLSMGGAIVAKFAADHPEKVNKVIFVDPSHRPFYSDKLGIPIIGEFIATVFMMPKAAEGQTSDFYKPEDFPEWTVKYQDQMQYKGFRNAILSTLRNFAKPDKLCLYEKIGNSGMESLLIWGRQDKTLPLTDSVRVAKALKTETFIVEESGHLPHYEHPEIVNPKILSFLLD